MPVCGRARGVRGWGAPAARGRAPPLPRVLNRVRGGRGSLPRPARRCRRQTPRRSQPAAARVRARRRRLGRVRRRRHRLQCELRSATVSADRDDGPDSVIADRGYDHDKYRRLVWQRGIKPVIARRQSEHGSGLGRHRWVVERTLLLAPQPTPAAAPHRPPPRNPRSVLSLACCLICWRRLETAIAMTIAVVSSSARRRLTVGGASIMLAPRLGPNAGPAHASVSGKEAHTAQS